MEYQIISLEMNGKSLGDQILQDRGKEAGEFRVLVPDGPRAV